MQCVFLLWFVSGIIGFILYCMNSNVRPKNKGLLIAAFCTHTFLGLIGLLYGYICFAGRKNKIKNEK